MFAKQTGRLRLAALLLAAMVALTMVWGLPQQAQAKDYSTVRVKLSNANDGTINLRFTGSYTLEQTGGTVSGDILLSINGSDSVKVSSKSSGAVLYTGKSVRFNRTSGSGTFRMYTTANGNREYLGDLLVTASGTSFTAINHVPMDHYLYGVVAYEMNNSWPLEALKAQAVAARSYAAARLSSSGTYDLGDTPSDQVYKGYNSAFTNVKEAVDATSGQVLTQNGKIITCYYGASNGGQTELTSNVWTASTAYCTMKDDPYDLRNPMSPRQTIFFPKTISSSTPMDGKLVSYLKTQVAPVLKSKGYSTYSDQIEILGIDSLVGSQRKYDSPSRNYTHVKATVRVKAMQGNGDGLVVTTPSGSKPTKPTFTEVGESTSGPIYADASGNLYDAASVQFALEQYEATLAEWENGQSSLESSGQGFSGSGSTMSVEVEFRIYDLKDKNMSAKLFTNHSLIMYYPEETEGGWNLVNARYGHGVGMSQRGAQQMGNEGMSYKDILTFYYTDVELTSLDYDTAALTDIPTDSGASDGSADVGGEGDIVIPEDVIDLDMSGEEPLTSAATSSGNSGVTLNNTNLFQTAAGNGKVATARKGAELNVLAQSGDMLLVQTQAGTTGFASVSDVGVSGGRATVKSAANLLDESGNTIGSVSAGDSMTILARSGEQYQVQTSGGATGYLPVNAVQLRVDNPRVILPDSKRYGVTIGKIRLYTDKSGKTTLDTLSKGSLVEIISKTTTGFYNVVHDGRSGAVKMDYITVLRRGADHPDPESFIASYLNQNSASASYSVAAGVPQAKYYGARLSIDPAINDGESGAIKGQTVNMRKEASTSASIVKQLPGGEKVTILSSVGDFYKVRDSAGAEGYVAKDYVTVNGAATASSSGASSKPTSRIGIVRSEGVNVRSSASSDASIVGTLTNGEQVSVIGSSGSFYKIRSSSGMEGYVSDSYLTVQEVETDMVESVDDNEDSGGSSTSANTNTSSASSTGKVVAYGTITGASVNMRAKPSSSAEILTTIPAGAEVGIMATNSGYYKISYDGKTGYVLSTYVPSSTLRQSSTGGGSTSGSSSGGGSSSQTGTVTASSSLRLRTLEGTVIGTLAKGAKVTILETLSDRYKVSANGQVGYVSKQYVKLDGSSGSSSSSGGSSSGSGQTGTVSVTSSLRLRDANGNVIGALANGTKVTIQGSSGDQYKVSANGQTGYVSKQYIKLDGSSSSGSSSKGYAHTAVNVRATASTSAKRLGVVYKNESVTILATEGDWYKIEAKGMTGYVLKQYITKL